MCTVVLLIRPGHAWPVVMAANRDEMLERAWDPPGPHWPGQPDVVGGRDRAAGGTWMAMNGAGVVAAVLNRQGSLGPAPGKRSRGELPLLALKEGTAKAAAQAIAGLDAGQWRSFNMILADRLEAIAIRAVGAGEPEAKKLGPGVHMVTAHDVDDPASPRVARHLPRFRAAAAPEAGDWREWQAILADQSGPPGSELNVPPRGGFGTSCASLLALPADGAPEWLFAPGAPHTAAFSPVQLSHPVTT
jgi:uncharacterized protein with NRDE domain